MFIETALNSISPKSSASVRSEPRDRIWFVELVSIHCIGTATQDEDVRGEWIGAT